jgi:hypothetical protein
MLRSSASAAIATMGIDLGKNSFHLVGQDERGAIVLRLTLSVPSSPSAWPISRPVSLALRLVPEPTTSAASFR